MTRRARTLVVVLAASAAVALVPGCGGDGGASSAVTVLPSPQAPHQIGRYCSSDKTMVADKGEKGFLSFGPYAALKPGLYEATFDVAVEGAPGHSGPVGRVDVNAFDPGRPIGVLSSVELAADGASRQIRLRFSADAQPRYEFRVSSEGNAVVRLKGIAVDRVRPSP